MYSMAECPTCERARVELRELGTPYEERLVDGNPEHQREVLRLTLQRTVPVFVKDGKAVVGFHGERG
jgi:glutathione S-transferase